MRLRSLIFLGAVAAALGGCGAPSAPGIPSVAGNWALVGVNGVPIPAVISSDPAAGTFLATSGTATFGSDGRFSIAILFHDANTPSVTDTIAKSGKYIQNGNELSMSDANGGLISAFFQAGQLSIAIGAPVFTFLPTSQLAQP